MIAQFWTFLSAFFAFVFDCFLVLYFKFDNVFFVVLAVIFFVLTAISTLCRTLANIRCEIQVCTSLGGFMATFLMNLIFIIPLSVIYFPVYLVCMMFGSNKKS